MTSVTPASAAGARKQGIVLHVLFPGGGDPITAQIFQAAIGQQGHYGVEAVGLENAMTKVLKWFREVKGSVYIKELELIAHGTAWRRQSSSEVTIEPPAMWAGDRRVTYKELQSMRVSLELQEPFRDVETLIITACNLGHYSQDYVNFRTRLAQLLFCPARTDAQNKVQVRSVDAYIGSYRNPQTGKPEEDPKSEAVPKWEQSKYGGKVVVENFYKDTGYLLQDRDKTGQYPTLHHALGWG